MRKYFFLIVVALFFWACHHQPTAQISNKDVIAKEEMIQLLSDMHLADAAVQGLKINRDSSDKLYKLYYAQIFEKHKTNTTQFKKSLQYYTQHPEMMDQMYMKVVENLSIKNN
jgi:hypothetical protein